VNSPPRWSRAQLGHRLLKTVQAEDMVTPTGDGRYQLGWSFLAIANDVSAVTRSGRFALASPEAAERRVDETVILAFTTSPGCR